MTSPESRSIKRRISRAVVDLPQPLSPTMPSVSPWNTSNETPSTAETRPRLNTPSLTGNVFLSDATLSNGWDLAGATVTVRGLHMALSHRPDDGEGKNRGRADVPPMDKMD